MNHLSKLRSGLSAPAVLVAFAAGLLAAPVAAQSPNPRGAVNAEVGGATVSIDYGRPALGDRMLSDLLAMLPEDRVWRAGENQVTILETSGDISIGGHTVPAGRYSLYLLVPDSGDGWSLLVNRDQGVRLGEIFAQASPEMQDEMWPRMSGYASIMGEEQARVELEEADGSMAGDTFEISVSGGTLTFAWAGTAYQTSLGSP